MKVLIDTKLILQISGGGELILAEMPAVSLNKTDRLIVKTKIRENNEEREFIQLVQQG